jgi:5-formyltetrahydrofolate cyclo-ligase
LTQADLTVSANSQAADVQLAAQQSVREEIWAALRKVARPDSRFHWDFSSFIADFIGSERCAQTIRQFPEYSKAGLLFITPDNCLESFREAVLVDRKPYVMTTYGIVRGFMYVDPEDVANEDQKHASTLDGVEGYARFVSLAELRLGEPVQLLVTGASAISTSGVRFGKGHGYFDLEWAILSELDLVSPSTTIIAVGHDCQVVDAALPAFTHDTVVDFIVTPTRTIAVQHAERAVGRIDWERVSPGLLDAIPSLGELRDLLAGTSS